MREIAAFDGLLIVHAEDADAHRARPDRDGGRRTRDFLALPAARGREPRDRAPVIELARRTGVPGAHPAPVQRRRAAADRRRAQARRACAITVETCPHYLTLRRPRRSPTAPPQFKCCPPIREAANRDLLWEGLADGDDRHASSPTTRPRTPDLKRLDTGDFGAAWGGISSLQLGLPAVWTEARAPRVHASPTSSAGWRRGPADAGRAGPQGRASRSARDADLAVFAPDGRAGRRRRATAAPNPITPYAGRRLTGVVRSTWLRRRAHRPGRGASWPSADARSVGRRAPPARDGLPDEVVAALLDG